MKQRINEVKSQFNYAFGNKTQSMTESMKKSTTE